jgi:hypothetical protein
LIHILDRISLQYAPNANERKTHTKRTNASNERYEKRTIHEANARYTKRTHDTRNERSIHERTKEMKRTNYTENANERTHDTRNERTIHETNARYTNERIIGA